jgi:hypothetical protein
VKPLPHEKPSRIRRYAALQQFLAALYRAFEGGK